MSYRFKHLFKAFKPLVFSACLLGLAACSGSSSDASAPSLNKITYDSVTGQGTLKDYMNADWLFQNYFGQYGIPESEKQTLKQPLQLLANGFMVQYKRGDDVKKNIEQVHQMFMAFMMSEQGREMMLDLKQGTARKNFAQAQAQEKQFKMQLQKALKNGETVELPPEPEPGRKISDEPMSDEQRAQLEADAKEDHEMELDLQAMYKAYELPYTIEGSAAQYVIVDPKQMGKGGGGKGGTPSSGGGGGSSDCGRFKTCVSDFDWTTGDMIWSNGSWYNVFGHVGVVLRQDNINGRRIEITDASPDRGVYIWSGRNAVKDWANRYSEVRAYRFSGWEYSLGDLQSTVACYHANGPFSSACNNYSYNGINAKRRVNAYYFAAAQKGRPYNYQFGYPYDTSKYYCSSLVWRAYWEQQINPSTGQQDRYVGGIHVTGDRVTDGDIVLPSELINGGWFPHANTWLDPLIPTPARKPWPRGFRKSQHDS